MRPGFHNSTWTTVSCQANRARTAGKEKSGGNAAKSVARLHSALAQLELLLRNSDPFILSPSIFRPSSNAPLEEWCSPYFLVRRDRHEAVCFATFSVFVGPICSTAGGAGRSVLSELHDQSRRQHVDDLGRPGSQHHPNHG